jgi:hypothetical protein
MSKAKWKTVRTATLTAVQHPLTAQERRAQRARARQLAKMPIAIDLGINRVVARNKAEVRVCFRDGLRTRFWRRRSEGEGGVWFCYSRDANAARRMAKARDRDIASLNVAPRTDISHAN